MMDMYVGFTYRLRGCRGEKDTTTPGNPRICPIGLPMAGYLLGCFRIIEHPFDRQGRCRSVNPQLLWKTLWKKRA